MDILLVSGFLGAGKTTLLKHLITSPTEGVGKVAVLVNEFGDVGIDGTILSGQDIDIVELTSGCICCTIKTDFFKAIGEIHERVCPDLLLVESTGVAQPGDILDVLSDPTLKEFSRLMKLVTVVDAGFFKAREVLGTFYVNQIRCADIVILNKADSVEAEKDGERLSLELFQSVILASGMRSASGPDEKVVNTVPTMEIIGDAREVQDIFSAVHAGYNLALKY